MVFSRRQFVDENPKIAQAIVAALEEADRLIQEDPRRAAELYLAETREKLTVDELVEMMKQPGVVFSTTPSATMLMAEQMAKGGTLKTRPKNWKEFFFPFVHAQPGNCPELARISQCAPTARITSGGGFHPESCRLLR